MVWGVSRGLRGFRGLGFREWGNRLWGTIRGDDVRTTTPYPKGSIPSSPTEHRGVVAWGAGFLRSEGVQILKAKVSLSRVPRLKVLFCVGEVFRCTSGLGLCAYIC